MESTGKPTEKDMATAATTAAASTSSPASIHAEASKAVRFLHESEAEPEDPEAARRLRWKIDLRLLPVICLTYALQSIDKTTLGYAAVFGVQADLHLVGSAYSWTSSIFYLGYLAWEFPTNLLLQRLPINYVMAGTVVLWGAVLMCHAATHNFAGLAAVRAFLGVFEASINPGTMLLFTMYYARHEQPLRMGIWIGSAGLGYVVAGIASFGLGHVRSAIASWRLLFLFWGAITTAWGVVLLFVLPGSPLTTKLLTEHERALVVARIKGNGTGLEDKHFKWSQFREAMLDLKTWLLFLFAVSSNSPNGGLTAFQGLIIKGMGFSELQTTLIQMPSGGVQLIVCPLACYFASRYRNSRLVIMLLCLIPFLVGILGLWLLDESKPYGRLVCLWICFAYTATWTLSMAVATANTAGHTKKITTNAVLLIGYCLGNFIGPFFFKADQAPVYPLGVGMMFFCVGVQVAVLAALALLLWSRNRSRRAFRAEAERHEVMALAYEKSMLDETDWQNKYFQYVY
ncbi:major facilitator superfamily transporter [Niveomyces insectorum RCEF 264]|uniref:Major facilitator superfamily transporter n=1 Tax=Niveomyces insectorum RCEF 264 TaxID=1081102 RepID=A0A167S3Z1_9HYPO|nr:major facilitator superfamily transporter [Niveomyces insectorum RCEF 264]